MSQDYSPSLVTKNLVFCGDAAMKSAAGPATLLYDKVNDNNGTMYNANCVDFDGTDDRVVYGDILWLDGLTTLSFSSWFYLDRSHPTQTGSVLLSKDNSLECWVKLSSTDQYVMSINNNHVYLDGGGTPAFGEWVYVVMTWNSTGDVRKLYLNGVLKDTETSGTQSGNSINNSANGLTIGARDSAAFEIDGKMADVKLFSKELSAANVKELYDDSKVIIPTKNDASGGFLSQTDLTLWAPLTDGAGTIAYDGSGYGRDGTYTGTSFLSGQTGAPQLVEGYNRPITFNVDASSTDYVDTGDVYAADEMTLVAWVNMSVVPSAATGNYPMMFGKRGTDTQRSYFFAFQKGSSKLYWEIKDAAGVYYIQYSTKTSWNANQWYHVAVNYVASTGIAKMYIDGVEDAGTFSPAQPWSLDPIPDTSATCRIGGGYYWFEGIINEAAIYNKALGATDIAALAATDANGGPLPPDLMTMSYSTSSTSSSNVIGYWRNDNNVTLTDLSGNSNTGTAIGSPDALLFKQGYNGQKNVNTGRDNQGFPLLCQNNGAVGFNGSDDEVVISHSSVFNITAEITQEIWFKADSFTNTGGGNFPTLIAKGQQNYRWYFSTSGTFVSRYAGLSDLNSATTFSTGQWYYVVLTKNTGGFKLYVNGVLNNEDSQSGAMSANTDNYVLGNWDEGGARAFQGQIANARIYNRALTYAEIQQNYNSFKVRFGK